ncbi:MAG: flagellar filament capping protein FliD [Dethiobacteria bacterium]
MNTLRIGGIISGFDTDQIVRDLMRIENMKVDKLNQEKQIIEWKKDQYRELINSIRSFRDKYFDLLNPATNMMSTSALGKINAVSSAENILTAVASGDALASSREIEIIQLATAARGVSSGGVTAIMSSEEITGELTVEEGKNVMLVNFNGSVKEIAIEAGTYSLDGENSLRFELQQKINATFGWDEASSKITVNVKDNKLKFETNSGVETLTLSSKTSAEDELLNQIKIGPMAGNRLDLSSTMEMIGAKLEEGCLTFDEDNKFILTINAEEIVIYSNDTLRTVLNKINNSAAGVTLTYSSFTDTFTLQSKTTGEGTIEFDGGGGFFQAIKINDVNPGQNVKFTIDGSDVASRSNNTFTVDGVTYTAVAEGSVTVTTSVDVEGIYETIESFINDYNSLIEKINDKLKEERFPDFSPLNDEQKKEMSEKEIELWEEKAKSGLLRRDPLLEGFLQKMREELYAHVGGLHLTAIGIETSSNYRDQGKLVLKDGGSVLRATIKDNPEKIIDIFTSRVEGQEGIAQRLNNVLNDYIHTTRDNSGRKGFLLERAGIVGDVTQFDNYYDKQIANLNKRIDQVNEMLFRKEERYYHQFAAMERALQQLYTQSDWLMMQFSQL